MRTYLIGLDTSVPPRMLPKTLVPDGPPDLFVPECDSAGLARLGVRSCHVKDSSLGEGEADRFFSRLLGDDESAGVSKAGNELVDHLF